MDIAAWLRSLGLESYEAAFRENEISKKVLPSLTAEEADLVGIFAHDFDGDQRGRGDLFPGISAVGEDALNEREDAPRSPQKRSAAVAILDARRMRFEHEATPVGVDERVALAPVDLLACIVT